MGLILYQEEKERLNLMYHAIRIVLEDRLFLAPVQNLQAALDVGTGTGIWAMDLGEIFHSTTERLELTPFSGCTSSL